MNIRQAIQKIVKAKALNKKDLTISLKSEKIGDKEAKLLAEVLPHLRAPYVYINIGNHTMTEVGLRELGKAQSVVSECNYTNLEIDAKNSIYATDAYKEGYANGY